MSLDHPKYFYQFSGIHSLLVGLLPFFIPVLLWQRGVSLAQISAFIAITGVGFIATLWYWDRLRAQQHWSKMVALSLVAETLLVGALLLEHSLFILALTALIYGAYNCLYWSTQRAFFNRATNQKNTGKTFGNFQILVVILLKTGILIGGYMLANHGIYSIGWLSVAIALIGLLYLAKERLDERNNATTTPEAKTEEEPALTAKEIVHFKDNNNSKLTFILDGPFLFLESYFWVLSLYFLIQQDLVKLSVTVVFLTAFLALVFYLIKNKIDQADQQRMFSVAVIFYALSWLLRGQLNTETPALLMYSSIVVIAFFTTFFRLAFNKRFFDTAKETRPSRYLVLKSYYSQLGLVVFFGVLALVFANETHVEQLLALSYWLVFPLALTYCFYANRASKFLIFSKKISSKILSTSRDSGAGSPG